MLPWIGRSLIVLLTIGLSVILKSNMESGFVVFALATAVSIILSEINDGLITIAVLTLVIFNILANNLLDEKFVLTWSDMAIIVATAVLIELLLSTSQEAAFLDFFTLISTALIIILWPHFLMSLPIVSGENYSISPVPNVIKIATAKTSIQKQQPAVINSKTHNLIKKSVVKPIKKLKPIIKPITKLKPKFIKSVKSIQPNLHNATIIKIKHNSIPKLIKVANEKHQTTQFEQGTAQRLFSIAAMVVVYLIVL